MRLTASFCPHGSHAAQIEPFVGSRVPESSGEKAAVQHRLGRGQVPGAAGGRGGAGRLKEGFEIDRHRVLTLGDQVLVVEIGGLQGIEQGHPGPLPLVEALHLLRRRAGAGGDVLHPAVAAAVENRETAQRWRALLLVEPGDERLEPPVDGQGLGLVDGPQPRGKGEDRHRSPAAVTVAEPALDGHYRPRLRAGGELADDCAAVFGEAPHHLQARLDPLLRVTAGVAGQHRVAPEDLQGGGGLAQDADEAPEPFLRGLPWSSPWRRLT